MSFEHKHRKRRKTVTVFMLDRDFIIDSDVKCRSSINTVIVFRRFRRYAVDQSDRYRGSLRNNQRRLDFGILRNLKVFGTGLKQQRENERVNHTETSLLSTL